MQYTVTYVESYRWFVRNTKEKMQDKYAGTMNVLLHKGHSWFLLLGEIPFEGKRGTYLCIFQKRKLSVCSSVFVLTLILSMTVFAAEKAPKPEVVCYFLGIDPSRCGDCFALITKEVYSSLFVGILVGALLYSGFSFEKTVVHIFEGGIISVLSDKYNVGILVFLVILGTMNVLDEQSRRFRSIRRMGRTTYQITCGRTACDNCTWCVDFY